MKQENKHKINIATDAIENRKRILGITLCEFERLDEMNTF